MTAAGAASWSMLVLMVLLFLLFLLVLLVLLVVDVLTGPLVLAVLMSCWS